MIETKRGPLTTFPGLIFEQPREGHYKEWGKWLTTPRPAPTTTNPVSYLVTRTSTRRFMARPAAVVFGSTGLVSAYPVVVASPRPPSASAFAAAVYFVALRFFVMERFGAWVFPDLYKDEHTIPCKSINHSLDMT